MSTGTAGQGRQEIQGREEPQGCLWIVATPIGTIGDLSGRATSVLSGADLVLAEDTRRLAQLVRAAGLQLSGRTLSFHEHNEKQRLPKILDALAAGQEVVLTSDAGTPALSDPGFALVRQVRRRGLAVRSVPGPSAFTAALAASGQPPLPAVLAGFLPPRAAARRRKLEAFTALSWTIVFFLSPHRLGGELRDAAEVLGPRRPATLLAEISKLHERALMGTLEELASSAEVDRPRGEYALVAGPAEPATQQPGPPSNDDPGLVLAVYHEAVRRGHGRNEALHWTADRLGLSRRRVFQLLEDAAGAE